MIDEWAIPENLPAVLNIQINEVILADDRYISALRFRYSYMSWAKLGLHGN